MNNWDKGVAPAICPAYLVLVYIDYELVTLPQTSADQWILASSRSVSTTSEEVNMQGK